MENIFKGQLIPINGGKSFIMAETKNPVNGEAFIISANRLKAAANAAEKELSLQPGLGMAAIKANGFKYKYKINKQGENWTNRQTGETGEYKTTHCEVTYCELAMDFADVITANNSFRSQSVMEKAADAVYQTPEPAEEPGSPVMAE